MISIELTNKEISWIITALRSLRTEGPFESKELEKLYFKFSYLEKTGGREKC